MAYVLHAALPAAASTWAARPVAGLPGGVQAAPIALDAGLYLLIDDFWLAERQNVSRRVSLLERERADPVVTSGAGFRNVGGGTVLYDPITGRFRLWYGAANDAPADDFFGPLQAYLESADGIHWAPPYFRIDSIDVTYGHSILDEGEAYAPAGERYKQVYLRLPNPYRGSYEIRAAHSPDGLHWSDYSETPIFPTNKYWGDLPSLFYYEECGCYGLFHTVLEPYAWTNAAGQALNEPIRLVGLSTSSDFQSWTEPQVVALPDDLDPGVTQFYSAAAIAKRGDLYLGVLRVLRDDLNVAGAPPEAYGYADTVLFWSRDGRVWERDRHTDPFLVPDPRIGAWDHAHARVFSMVEVGEQLYVYYDGFRWGHKFNAETDRQIGLVRMEQDRFVAWEAGPTDGYLRTRPVILGASTLHVNVNAAAGRLLFRALDAEGNSLPGFTYADCRPITGDSLDAEVECTRPLSELRGLSVRLEFSLRDASLYAFTLRQP